MNPSWRERLNLSKVALTYPRLTIGFWLALAVAGCLAFSSLKYALFPEITFPVIIINAQAPLETSLTTEQQVTIPIEKALNSRSEIRDISSTTYPGRSVSKILFDIGIPLETATTNVKEALKALALNPTVTTEVIPIDLNESPVITYALVNPQQPLEELIKLAQTQVIPKLEALPGVLKVNLLGDSPSLVRFNAQEALALQVVKESRANTLEVVREVEKAVKNLAGINLILAETQAKYIREATQATINSLLEAIALAVLVIFPFLRNFRATLIAALAIPLSLLGTFIIMAGFGFNLETITLLALALVIGIVVDDGIVDVENIARHIDRGASPKTAALLGTQEIGLIVTASTITIAAVFIPVAFMGGAVGKFFQPFGLTVSAAVIFSLLVARTLSPVLAAYWLKPHPHRQNPENNPQTGLYRRILHWSLRHRGLVIAIALASFLAGIILIPLIPKGFIPQLDRGEFNINFTTALPKISREINPTPAPAPAPTSPETGAFAWLDSLSQSPEKFLARRTLRMGEKIEAAVLATPDVESVLTLVGLRGEANRGRIYVRLKDARQLTTAQSQALVRSSLPPLKGVSVSVEDLAFVQTEAEKPLQMAIKGDNIENLRENAQRLAEEVRKSLQLKDVSLSYDKNAIERLDGQRSILLSANLGEEKGLEDAAIAVEGIAQKFFPAEITLERWGNAAQSNDVLSSFGRTISLSLLLMTLTLLLLFGRLLEPLVVALSVPLAIVGAMRGLLLIGSSFSIISLIGLIFLLGLLNKNALLLMDYANLLRQQGWGREEALLETGVVRLRPILMTTASTLLGMMPIALGWGAGAELRQPMAVVIMGGLITSSLLSLIVVPVLYTLLEDAWRRTN
jgi:multidrug efflux pump subunit AcrB